MNARFTPVKPTLDEQILALHDLLRRRNAPKPGSYSALGEQGKRAYHAEAARQQRERKKRASTGTANAPPIDTGTVREVLSDAALMLLAIGGPGAAEIEAYLCKVFADRPAIALKVRARAKAGKLKPLRGVKLSTRAEKVP